MKNGILRPRFLPAGDAALTVEFGDGVSEELNGAVMALDEAVRASGMRGILETVPTYRSLLVYYDPRRYGFTSLSRKLRSLASPGRMPVSGGKRVFRIPVGYGGGRGPDLEAVARHTGLEPGEVVRRHCAAEYRIYMLGFLPGFAYLGGLDPALETPRLDTPRQKIPAGSVGIGGNQTGIYPLASPGGWRLIGTTPVRVYDPARAEPILYRAGDYVRFVPVGEAEYAELERRAASGEAIWD